MPRKKPFPLLNGSSLNFSWSPFVVVFHHLCHYLLLLFFLILNLTYLFIYVVYLVVMDGGGAHAS